MDACCPYSYPLQLLSRKWTYFVLRTLQYPRSFSAIKHELHFVTNRMLSHELKILQEEGIVHKHDVYELTRAGKALLKAIEALVTWSITYKGSKDCCPEQRCTACTNYQKALDIRAFV